MTIGEKRNFFMWLSYEDLQLQCCKGIEVVSYGRS